MNTVRRPAARDAHRAPRYHASGSRVATLLCGLARRLRRWAWCGTPSSSSTAEGARTPRWAGRRQGQAAGAARQRAPSLALAASSERGQRGARASRDHTGGICVREESVERRESALEKISACETSNPLRDFFRLCTCITTFCNLLASLSRKAQQVVVRWCAGSWLSTRSPSGGMRRDAARHVSSAHAGMLASNAHSVHLYLRASQHHTRALGTCSEWALPHATASNTVRDARQAASAGQRDS